ncbi:MAG: gliding motility-associated C-terminal domain-containing protein, partial [Flavobacterium sp.]|nr:gliding motility-associated C-terminal domain-containing protein [Flavobacterium sp.]
TLINTTSSVATVVYTVTPVSGLCVGADFTVTVTVNPSINPNVSVSNSTCYDASNGSIETNITGGIPFPGTPYQILWTGPGGFSSTDASIYNLEPGVYNVTITDAGGCPYGGTFTITEPDELIIGTDLANNITCYDDNDGEISVTMTGGTLPYIYTWTKNSAAFATTEDIANLGPGVYSLSVTDANNCAPATISFTIVEPPLLTVSLLSQTNILCYGAATGTVSVNVGGGIPVEVSPGVYSYNFNWSGPNGFTSSDQDLSGLLAGTYDLTISDQNGCVQNLSVTITQNPEIVLTAATTPITCYGANNASISLTVSGGVAPYQAAWDNLATGFFQDNLSAGTYVITVTDALNCQQIISVVIPEAPVFTTTPVVTQISCHGANDGSIQLNLVGGIAPVVLTWSDGSNQGTTRNNLPPGTYTAVISDGTPCYITQTFTIVEPAPLVVSANVQNALACGNAASGSIDLTVNGGTMPYSFSWSNGANTEDLSGLTAGNYAVTVTDSRGCVATAQYQVTSPLPLVVDIQTQVQANCTTGEVYQVFTANVTGGFAPYVMTWSSGTVSGANGEVMTTNQSTLILFEVTDDLGCTSSQSFQITNPVINNAPFGTTSTGYETYGYYSIVDPVYFMNNATGDYETISWNFGDGTFSTEENPVHSYIIEGEYVVTQTVTYPFGCVYTHVITLLVKKGYFLAVPNAFTPNGDSLNDNFRPVTKGLKNVKLTIYDTWGSVIYSEEGTILTGWNGVINNMPAENGNYYCKVSAETFYGTVVHENHPFVLIK